MPRKKRSTRKPSNNRGKVKFWKITLLAMLVLMIASGIYVLILDQRLQEKMSGRIWALPSQVFARSLELYVGRPLQPAQLESELLLIGYKRVSTVPTVAGQFRQWDGAHFEVITRDFRFGDGHQKGGAIRADFCRRRGDKSK